jgi:hypothetical protein
MAKITESKPDQEEEAPGFPESLSEPPIGEKKKAGTTTGRRTTEGVWVVYLEEGTIAQELYPDELPALRAVAAGSGLYRYTFVPWGSSLHAVLRPGRRG